MTTSRFVSSLVALLLAGAAPVSLAAQGAPGCPPGLAKKTPSCVPPGQAKKRGWAVGDIVADGQGWRIREPWRYDWGSRGTYLVLDGRVVHLDPDTRAILSIIGAAAELLD